MRTSDGEPAGAVALELRSYRVRRHVPELQIDATFPAGVNLLLGFNGVGKTTLLRSLAHPKERAPGSSARLDGAGPDDLALAGLSLLPQRPALPARLRVRDLLDHASHVRGVPVLDKASLIEPLGLSDLLDRRVGRLSGGETQRLNLAVAFVGSPAVVLLDEPTVALDPVARVRFGDAVRALAGPGAVILISTHVASDIDIADRVFLQTRTGIGWHGTPGEFLAHDAGGSFDRAFAHLLQELAC